MPSNPEPHTRTLDRSPNYSGNGIRTRVPALRGLCPSPLDDTAIVLRTAHFVLLTGCVLQSAYYRGTAYERPQQARRESNPQPPVLETGALPIELRT